MSLSIVKSFKDYSIRTKLMVIISSLILISLLLLIAIVVGLFQDDMRNMIALLNSRTGKLLSEKLQTELDDVEKNLSLIATLQKEKGQNLAKNIFQKNPILLLVAGEDFFFTKKTDFISTESLKEIYNSFKKNSHNKQRRIFNLSHLSQRPLWGIVSKSNSDVLAILDAEPLRIAFLLDAKNIRTGSQLYTTMLFDKEKNLLLHPDLSLLSKISDTNWEFLEKIWQMPARNGVLRFPWKDHIQYGAFQKLWQDNLVLISSMREDLALEGVYIARLRSLLVALLIITLSILFVYFFARTISQPIKNLVVAAQSIREGNYDLWLTVQQKDEIGELTQAFIEMKEGLLEREKLRGALNKFVNPEIAKMVLKKDLTLGGEIREVSVLFCDIRSFTPLAEGLNPKEVVDFLNEYMSLMVSVIHRNKGVVDKFIGDAIMAVWGAPISHGQDTHDSVKAALEMRENLLLYNEERQKRNLPPIKIGIGIASGPALAGQIGSQDRLEYTVIGDTVNLASRLEGLNKAFGTDILISESTYEQIKNDFRIVPLQRILVKGKSQPQKIYAVLGKENDGGPNNLKELQKLLQIKPQGKLKKISI